MTCAGRRSRITLLALCLVLGACTAQGPLAEAERAEQIEPVAGESYYDLGVRLLRAGEPESAQRAFSASLSSEARQPEALAGSGIAAARLGKLNEARRLFEHSLRLDAESVVTQNNLGVVLYRLGKFHEAKKAFQSAFIMSSGSSDIAIENLKLSEQAIAYLQGPPPDEYALSHDVQRVGSSLYRILVIGEEQELGEAIPAAEEATEGPAGDATDDMVAVPSANGAEATTAAVSPSLVGADLDAASNDGFGRNPGSGSGAVLAAEDPAAPEGTKADVDNASAEDTSIAATAITKADPTMATEPAAGDGAPEDGVGKTNRVTFTIISGEQ